MIQARISPKQYVQRCAPPAIHLSLTNETYPSNSTPKLVGEPQGGSVALDLLDLVYKLFSAMGFKLF